MASPQVVWDLVRGFNSFIVRKDGTSFSLVVSKSREGAPELSVAGACTLAAASN